MKNLRIVSHNVYALDEPFCSSQLAIDPISGTIYIANVQGIFLADLESKTCIRICHWEDEALNVDKIVNATFVSSLNGICVTTLNNIIVHNLDEFTTETGGSVSIGILASCWSPDQELFVVVTAKLSVILMTAEFDQVCEIDLACGQFGAHAFVDVGWGKRETQFHGSAGKAAAVRQIGIADVLAVNRHDNGSPVITWRGDGQLFAVGYVAAELGNRKFRVFDREGSLLYTSQNVEGQEQCLAWRPSGNLLATSQRLGDKHNVIFFEKNGLQHGQFTMTSDPLMYVVRGLCWNQDSSILLLHIYELLKDTEVIQLWRMSNYHYYFKQEFTFDSLVLDIAWDEMNPQILYVLTSKYLKKYRILAQCDASAGIGCADLAQTAVIDGNKALITPFRRAIIPPPMCFYEFRLPHVIKSVMFPTHYCPDDSLGDYIQSHINDICIYHGKNIFTFFTLQEGVSVTDKNTAEVTMHNVSSNGLTTMVPRVYSSKEIKCEIGNTSLIEIYNCRWISKCVIFCCAVDTSGGNYVMCIDVSESSVDVLVPLDMEPVCVSNPFELVVAIQLKSGALMKFDFATKNLIDWVINGNTVNFAKPCESILLRALDSSSEPIPFALANHRFLMGNEVIRTDCKSFLFHDHHLLMTTTTSLLLALPLERNALLKQSDNASGSRSLERGSELVTVVSRDTKVLLQMPRGNLETIHPRPLVIHFIKDLLDRKEYRSALSVMRRNRIDQNLVYDHNPRLFLSNRELFVRNVDKSDWIDIFIANLTPADITKSTYSHGYPSSTAENITTDKLTTICTVLRSTMQTIDPCKFLLPILTSFIKESKLELALEYLITIREAQKTRFDEGLRHLLYVADADQLCDVALGTYNFDVVMTVFEKSQKDPKEYLPILNGFRNIEDEPFRRYTIDVHLRRHVKALQNYVQSSRSDHTDVVRFIGEKDLFRDALDIFPARTDIHRKICREFAGRLSRTHRTREAAHMYAKADQLALALQHFQRAGEWQHALSTARQLAYSPAMMLSLCRELTAELVARQQYAAAASLYESYLGDCEAAVVVLCTGNLWEDAMYVAYKHSREDLIDTNIKPDAVAKCQEYVIKIVQRQQHFDQLRARLELVRAEKSTEFDSVLEGASYNDDCDLQSDVSGVSGMRKSRLAGSCYTLTSGKSYRSNKSRRKLERKKYSTKEGSTYEDLGLVAAIYDTIEEVYALAPIFRRLTSCLVLLQEDKRARQLQTVTSDLIRQMEKHQSDVWPQPSEADGDIGGTSADVMAVAQRDGFQAKKFLIQNRMCELDAKYRIPPISPTSDWILKCL